MEYTIQEYYKEFTSIESPQEREHFLNKIVDLEIQKDFQRFSLPHNKSEELNEEQRQEALLLQEIQKREYKAGFLELFTKESHKELKSLSRSFFLNKNTKDESSLEMQLEAAYEQLLELGELELQKRWEAQNFADLIIGPETVVKAAKQLRELNTTKSSINKIEEKIAQIKHIHKEKVMPVLIRLANISGVYWLINNVHDLREEMAHYANEKRANKMLEGSGGGKSRTLFNVNSQKWIQPGNIEFDKSNNIDKPSYLPKAHGYKQGNGITNKRKNSGIGRGIR